MIILCVCWSLRHQLSFPDLVEMMAERGLNPAHTTILRKVKPYPQSWSGVGTELVGPLSARRESMRPISRYAAAGAADIEQWTRLGRRSTSDSAGYAM